MKSAILLLAALIAFAPAPAGAANYNRHRESANYVTPGEVPPTILPAPYAEGSEEWQREVNSVAAAQKIATPGGLKAANEEIKTEPEIVTRVLGRDFNRESLPATFNLLDKAGRDVKLITYRAKQYWRTTRPYAAAPDKVKMLLKEPLSKNSYAYPSGHTSASAVWAEILAELEPEAAEKLRKRHRHRPASCIGWRPLPAGPCRRPPPRVCGFGQNEDEISLPG